MKTKACNVANILISIVACLVVTQSRQALAGAHKLTITDLSGYYASRDKKAVQNTLMIRLVNKYVHSGFDQANFVGVFGSDPIVGQGIISGDEGTTENFIRFDFMCTNPQDETSLVHCATEMRNDKVVGITVGTDDIATGAPANNKITYYRVSKAQYLSIYAKTDGRFKD